MQKLPDAHDGPVALPPYRVVAFNIAAQLENKIHDHDVAHRYGFSGGLVPGTAVFGYMVHQAVTLWGRDWLEKGSAQCHFSHPVYDGSLALVTAQHAHDQMDIEDNSNDLVCATGHAAIDSCEQAPDLALYRFSQPPLPQNRPVADMKSLAPGSVLCTNPYALTREQSLAWLAELRETDPVYTRENLMHPASLLRLCNWTLMRNLALGPWIHTASHIRNFQSMPVGASLDARAIVLKNWEHKGHLMVELDVLVLIDGNTPAARITHTAIYLPRQVRANSAVDSQSLPSVLTCTNLT